MQSIQRRSAKFALYDESTPGSLRPEHAEILVDRKYILAGMGLLSQHYPTAALEIMKKEIAYYGHRNKKLSDDDFTVSKKKFWNSGQPVKT